jgi:hypothetical protein
MALCSHILPKPEWVWGHQVTQTCGTWSLCPCKVPRSGVTTVKRGCSMGEKQGGGILFVCYCFSLSSETSSVYHLPKDLKLP